MIGNKKEKAIEVLKKKIAELEATRAIYQANYDKAVTEEDEISQLYWATKLAMIDYVLKVLKAKLQELEVIQPIW